MKVFSKMLVLHFGQTKIVHACMTINIYPQLYELHAENHIQIIIYDYVCTHTRNNHQVTIIIIIIVLYALNLKVNYAQLCYDPVASLRRNPPTVQLCELANPKVNGRLCLFLCFLLIWRVVTNSC